MSWFRLEAGFRDNVKPVRLAQELKVPLYAARGLLVSLWCWVCDQRKDGCLDGLTPREIAVAAAWDGDPEALFLGLVRSGLIDQSGAELQIHDWMTYAQAYREARAQDERRQAKKAGLALDEYRARKAEAEASIAKRLSEAKSPTALPTVTHALPTVAHALPTVTHALPTRGQTHQSQREEEGRHGVLLSSVPIQLELGLGGASQLSHRVEVTLRLVDSSAMKGEPSVRIDALPVPEPLSSPPTVGALPVPEPSSSPPTVGALPVPEPLSSPPTVGAEPSRRETQPAYAKRRARECVTIGATRRAELFLALGDLAAALPRHVAPASQEDIVRRIEAGFSSVPIAEIRAALDAVALRPRDQWTSVAWAEVANELRARRPPTLPAAPTVDLDREASGAALASVMASLPESLRQRKSA